MLISQHKHSHVSGLMLVCLQPQLSKRRNECMLKMYGKYKVKRTVDRRTSQCDICQQERCLFFCLCECLSVHVTLIVTNIGSDRGQTGWPVVLKRKACHCPLQPLRARRHALIRAPPLQTAVKEQAAASSHPQGPFNGLQRPNEVQVY